MPMLCFDISMPSAIGSRWEWLPSADVYVYWNQTGQNDILQKPIQSSYASWSGSTHLLYWCHYTQRYKINWLPNKNTTRGIKFEYYIMHRNMISNYYLILSKVPRDVWIQLRSRKMWSLASSWAASKPSGHIFWNRIFNSMSYGHYELLSHLAVCSWIIVQAETPRVSLNKEYR